MKEEEKEKRKKKEEKIIILVGYWWCMPLIPPVRQEDCCKLKANLCYRAGPCLKKQIHKGFKKIAQCFRGLTSLAEDLGSRTSHHTGMVELQAGMCHRTQPYPSVLLLLLSSSFSHTHTLSLTLLLSLNLLRQGRVTLCSLS